MCIRDRGVTASVDVAFSSCVTVSVCDSLANVNSSVAEFRTKSRGVADVILAPVQKSTMR